MPSMLVFQCFRCIIPFASRDERCDTYLDIHDIEKDAERIKTRRFMLKKLREIEKKEGVA